MLFYVRFFVGAALDIKVLVGCIAVRQAYVVGELFAPSGHRPTALFRRPSSVELILSVERPRCDSNLTTVTTRTSPEPGNCFVSQRLQYESNFADACDFKLCVSPVMPTQNFTKQ